MLECVLIIKDLLVIGAAICAIATFFIWKRQVILSRKLTIYEEFYVKFIRLYNELFQLYDPTRLYVMRVSDIDIKNDKELKERIHNYRCEVLTKNRKLYYEVLSFDIVLEKYFNLEKSLAKLSRLWMDLTFVTDNNYSNCPERDKNMLVFDDEFLQIYREDGIGDRSYTNNVLDIINNLKTDFDSALKKLIE